MNIQDIAMLHDAAGELGAAISQSIPSDDQIIMDHVRKAHETLLTVLRRIAAQSRP